MNLHFTFGIITDGGKDERLQIVIESIRKQSIPFYEIIIVGYTELRGDEIIYIPFDETLKKN